MAYSIQLADVPEWREAVEIDDDASTLFDEAGLSVDLPVWHSFMLDEHRRWASAAADGRLFFAVDGSGARIGFTALTLVDGAPYLEQLSVRRAAMGKGAGRFLLNHAVMWATARHAQCLWLTTYGHLSWNRAFYERVGFVVVPETTCGPGVRSYLERERRALPAPEHRIAMRRRLGGPPPHASPLAT